MRCINSRFAYLLTYISQIGRTRVVLSQGERGEHFCQCQHVLCDVEDILVVKKPAWTLQQDGAPSHTACQEHLQCDNVTIVEPSNSAPI